MPTIGAVLGGKYRVHAKLGEGGMGAVYRAENIVTGKQVAIKWMHPHVAARSESSARLLREAQATSRIDHPNIVDVYDIVQDDKTLFMVMELLEGETLRAYFARLEPVKISELVALLLPAIDGVAVAHENGVIHRDLKPDNIFLARSRSGAQVTAKVLDFGVAKLATNHGLTLTDTGAAMGTPLYMSLEQLRGDRDVDARADVYALGAMLYEAMAGVTPFQADTLPELVFKVTSTEPRPLKELRPDIPTPLANLVTWAIARQRDQRLPNLRALIRELEPFARDRGFAQQMTNPEADAPRLAVRSRSALSPITNTLPLTAADDVARAEADVKQQEHDTLKARVLDTQERQRKRSPLVWIAGAAIIAVATVAALWLREPPPPSPQLPAAASALAPAVHEGPSTEDAPVEPPPVASKAATAGVNLDPGKISPPAQVKVEPPLPAAAPLKPARSVRAPQPRQPAPITAEPPAQPQRATQAGKTAAEVLAF